LREYKGYLFDMDGTLVGSEKLKSIALTETCVYFGGKVDSHIYKDVMGNSWEDVVSLFYSNAGISPDIDDFEAKFKEIYAKKLKNDLEMTPGAKEFLQKLSEKNKNLGVVSSGSLWMVKQILEKFELSQFFDFIITGEDVTHHKPHAEPYLLALKKLSLNCKDVLIFEDTNAGVRSANSTGCDVIAIQHDFNINNDFNLALQVISGFNQL
jgi:HAD superfamily hydrolase (TIGR01509 family)